MGVLRLWQIGGGREERLWDIDPSIRAPISEAFLINCYTFDKSTCFIGER